MTTAPHNKMEPSNDEIDETQKVESVEEKSEVKSVVESSNGESKEKQKVEYQAEDKKVVVQDVGDVEAVVESVREIVLDGDSELVDETSNGGDLGLINSSFDREETSNEKSSERVESRELEEKEVSSSVVDFEAVVSLSKDFVQGVEELVENSIGLKPKERKEKASLSTNDNNVVSKEFEETTLPTLDENGEVPLVVTEEIEETKLISSNASVGEASKENLKTLLQPFPVVDAINAIEERNKTEIPESAGNSVSTLRIDHVP